MSWARWISRSIRYHIRMWHPEVPPDVVVYNTLIAMSYGISCLIWYQMIKIIIKHGIHISTCHSRKNRLIRVSKNKLHIVELPHDAFRQMRIHHMWIASQPFGVEGYVFQRTCLTMTIVRKKVYILCYHATKIHFVWLCRLIPSKWGECISTWHILGVGRHRWLKVQETQEIGGMN